MNAITPICKGRLSMRGLLENGLPVLTVNTVIALGLTAIAGGEFADNLVYSHCIGICIWCLMAVASYFWLREPRQQWRRLFLIVPLAVVLGFFVGVYGAAMLLSQQVQGFWSQHPREVLGLLLMSLAAGGTLTYYFMSREQIAAANADMAYAAAQTESARRQATESRLMLLQSQLEPHMLFNTLANLRALIGTDPLAATAMLDHLNAYLRATLNASRASSHSLQTEFDRLRDYLELIAVRMGPRLRYSLELPDALAQLPIPPLLLQPLVENAIKHGLEPKVEGGSLSVGARFMAGTLILEVSDSGIGLATDFDSTRGFGLAQVRERLATTYGDQGLLTLQSDASSGTRAQVSLPCQLP